MVQQAAAEDRLDFEDPVRFVLRTWPWPDQAEGLPQVHILMLRLTLLLVLVLMLMLMLMLTPSALSSIIQPWPEQAVGFLYCTGVTFGQPGQ